MSEGVHPVLFSAGVRRHRAAIGRRLELLMQADADDLTGPLRLRFSAKSPIRLATSMWPLRRGNAPMRCACEAGDRAGAAEAAVRVAMHLLLDTALMAPVRGWLGRADDY